MQLSPLKLHLLRGWRILLWPKVQIFVVLELHPWRQVLFFMPNGEDVPQSIDLEFVKIFVYSCVQQTLELYYATIDLVLFLLLKCISLRLVSLVGFALRSEA